MCVCFLKYLFKVSEIGPIREFGFFMGMIVAFNYILVTNSPNSPNNPDSPDNPYNSDKPVIVS